MKKIRRMKNFAALAFTMALMLNIFAINGFAATKLTAPEAPTWDTTIPAKVKWMANANAESYKIELYKSPATGVAVQPPIKTQMVAKGILEFDFTDFIKGTQEVPGSGAGVYTATVTAVGDTTSYSDSDPSSKSVEFNLQELKAEWFSVVKQTYTGSELTAVVTVTTAGTAAGLANVSDVTITKNKGTTAGTTKVEITAKNPKFTGKTTADFVVDKKEVTVAGVTATEKVYNTLANDITLDISKAVLTGVVEADITGVTLENSAKATAKLADVGEQEVTTVLTLSGAKAANYTLAQPTDVKVAIAPKTLAVTGITAANTTYGDTTPNYTGTPTAEVTGLGYTYKYAGRNTTIYDSVTAPTAAGEYTLTVAIDNTANKNYTGSQVVDFTIAKKSLTVSGITIAEKTYDGDDIAALAVGSTPTLVGVATGEQVTLGVSPVFKFDNKNAGPSKAVTVTGYTLEGEDKDNYTLELPAMTGKINKAKITFTASVSQNKEYDGTTAVDFAKISLVPSGVMGADATDGGLTFTGYTGVYDNKNAGINKTVTISGVTLGGTNAANYTIDNPSITCQKDITKKNVNVSTDNIIAFVGDSRPTPVAKYSGFIAGETESVLTSGSSTITFATVVSDPIAAAEDNIGITLAPTADNYTFTNTTTGAKLTVLTKTISGTALSTTVPTVAPSAPTPVITAGTTPLPSGVANTDVTLVTLLARTADEVKLQSSIASYIKGDAKSVKTKDLDLVYAAAHSKKGQTVALSAPIIIAIKAADVGFDNIPSGNVAVVVHILPNGGTEYITPKIENGIVTFSVSTFSPFAFVVAAPKTATATPTPAPESPEPEADQFWSLVHDKIHKQAKNTTLAYDAGARTTMPGAIINDCIAKKVTLTIKWDGGKNVVLRPVNMKNTTQEMFNLKDLVGKYDKESSTTVSSKPEPSPSPTATPTPSPTPKPTIAPTPEPTEIPTIAPEKSGFPWVIVVVIAAIVGFGIFMVVRKKDDEEE